jgi:CBS domain-containing protein
VFHESLEKLERAYGSSQKLYTALEGVQSEWGGVGAAATPANASLLSYVQEMRERMSFPDLGSILDARTKASTVGVKTSVKDAARLMRENRTTAVVVLEENGKRIAGIFTSKDVVLRVIAAGLDARTCSVVRVMTPHPDTALPSLSIQEALRKMHGLCFSTILFISSRTIDTLLDLFRWTLSQFACRRRGCPIGRLCRCSPAHPRYSRSGPFYCFPGLLCAALLTHMSLCVQMNSISGQGGEAPGGGPMWARFFQSIGAHSSQDGETESVMSDSHIQTPSAMREEVHPNDSASVAYDDENPSSDIGLRRSVPAGGVAAASSIGLASAPAVDDGTYLFKFLSPSGITHRFQARYDSHELMHDIVSGKLASDPFFSEPNQQAGASEGGVDATNAVGPDPSSFSVFYTDDDGDLVLLSADRDILDAVSVAKKQGKDRVVLTLRGGRGWEEAMKQQSEVGSRKQVKNLLKPDDEDEEDGGKHQKQHHSRRRKAGGEEEELLFGVLPRDLALPAAVAFLGVALVGVFALSRTPVR